MKRTILGIVLCLAIVIGARFALPSLTTPSGGDFSLVTIDVRDAPDFRLERVQGGQLALSDLRGQVTLLYFWTTW